MKIVVETPKWSFRKFEKIGDEYKKVFFSPIPSPFNYGYIPGTSARDGRPYDVIVLGGRLEKGSELDLKIIGRVFFIDHGLRDDKYIASMDFKKRRLIIVLFFTFYAVAKLFLGLLAEHGLTYNRFRGVEWFETEISNPADLEDLEVF